MGRPGFRSFVALMILFAPTAPAAAEGGAQSFDQYPSFIELTSATKDGTQVVLRCGYVAPPGQAIALDLGFQEISVLNQQQGIYSRFQHIDNNVIATSKAPTGDSGLILELVRPDGSVTAKNCQTNLDDDTIQNCAPAQPVAAIDQIRAGEQKMGAQCAALLEQAAAQINPSLANPQKTETFKAGLRQKVNILEAP